MAPKKDRSGKKGGKTKGPSLKQTVVAGLGAAGVAQGAPSSGTSVTQYSQGGSDSNPDAAASYMTKRKGTTELTDEEKKCADLANPKHADPVIGSVLGGAAFGAGATVIVQRFRAA
jgi:hypothetical protein